jgi:RNA polymerase sigma-70 factor (ECF subfamily)
MAREDRIGEAGRARVPTFSKRRVGGPELRVLTGEVYPDWEAVYRDNVERIYRLMFAKVGNRPDAEDLTAEVFLAAFGPLRVSASVGEVRAYLLASARTVLAAHWRRHYGAQLTAITEAVEALAPVATGPEVAGEPPPSTAEAERLLNALPEQYRRVLRLRFVEGRSVRETAAAMGISVGNAKVLQHRALRRAGELIDEVGT